MRDLRQNRHRSGRSNMYSASKYSNWVSFQPYHSELKKMAKNAPPTRVITLCEDVKIRIYEQPIHELFLRPYTVDDLEAALRDVPIRFLTGLNHIFLLGGTKKQEQTFRSSYYYGFHIRQGWYFSSGSISLCAFPRKYLRDEWSYVPPPHVQQDFRRVGAKTYTEGNKWVCEFDEAVLRDFFLRDVLIHEIGHHVDAMRRGPKENLTEDFAEWFAGTYGFRNESL